jgi:hypothetical protein
MNLIKNLPDVEINGEILYSNEIFNHTLGHLNWFVDTQGEIIEKNISDINNTDVFYFVHFMRDYDFVFNRLCIDFYCG